MAQNGHLIPAYGDSNYIQLSVFILQAITLCTKIVVWLCKTSVIAVYIYHHQQVRIQYNNYQWCFVIIIKLGMHRQRPRAPGFLKQFLLVRRYVCVSAPRALITSHVKHMHNNQIKQFTAFPFLHMTLASDKLNGRGLSNNARCECLPKKTKIMWYQLQNYQAQQQVGAFQL